MKHVLVTGGAGFIGSHLVDAYLERGWRVSIIDNLSTGDRRNLNPRAEFHEADLREPLTMDLLDRIRPDVVNHQAAQVDVRISVADPAADAETNVIASLRLLQKSYELGVKRFIFASSGGAIYGEPVFAPQTEEHPFNPMSPYGCAKLAVEHYMNYFRQVHGMATVAMRYANVYGPRQSTRGEAGVIAIFIDHLLRGEQVVINGTGEQTRDFVYVADVAAANMAVSEPEELAGSFNVGTAVETSVNELYAAIARQFPKAPAAVHGPAKVGEQMRSVLAPGTVMTRSTPLSAGLKDTLQFFRS